MRADRRVYPDLSERTRTAGGTGAGTQLLPFVPDPQVPHGGPVRPPPARPGPLHHALRSHQLFSGSRTLRARPGVVGGPGACVWCRTVLPPGVGLFAPLAAGTLRHDLRLHSTVAPGRMDSAASRRSAALPAAWHSRTKSRTKSRSCSSRVTPQLRARTPSANSLFLL